MRVERSKTCEPEQESQLAPDSPSSKRAGYGSPPNHTRWQKGQCGNPNRRSRKRKQGAVALINKALRRPIDVVDNGVPRRLTVAKAIALLLLAKQMKGDQRAFNVFLRYRQFLNPRRQQPPPIIECVYQPGLWDQGDA